MPDQSSFDLNAQSAGPVNCLGRTFPSDDARREHYLKLLAAKLKEPAFRKIEGFPIGTDEAILSLSDPPYYTACPNPWVNDFASQFGAPYDPKKTYHREPFAADVSEGKNHPIYSAHSYHTKVPHRAIMKYILHYTEPGQLVLDGFCGTGMTGVAAQLCGDRSEVQALGYRVMEDGTILNEEGKAFSKLGARFAVLNDLSPVATFIARNYNAPVDLDAFVLAAKRMLADVTDECGWMFLTRHTDGREGRINYTLWSDVFACHECAKPIVFWDAAVDRKAGEIRDEFTCPHCGAAVSKRNMERIWDSNFDESLGKTTKLARQVPVAINYTVGGKRYDKKPDQHDLAVVERVQNSKIPYWFPTDALPDGFNTRQPRISHGIAHVHQFFTRRNLWTMAAFFDRARKLGNLHLVELVVNMMTRANRQSSLHVSNFFNGGGGVCKGHLTGTLYIPSLSPEIPATKVFEDRIDTLSRGYAKQGRKQLSVISTQSLSSFDVAGRADFVFLDPPFGANLNYSELNWNDESWFRIWTENKHEAIENDTQGKDLERYRALMTTCFSQVYAQLKPGRWMTVEFSNTQAAVWNSIQLALTEAGFVVANVSALDKKQGSFKAVTTPTAVKQDLVISAYKPNGGLEERFAKTGGTIAGVWDFVRTHLRNLPVVKARGGQLEPIAERDPRILYDRMVAFYVRHSTPVPISSAEFQMELASNFVERDGMWFLPEQVSEYDKKRAQMENVGQLAIFVEDERSAIDWLRNELKERPRSTQDVQPDFMQQLNASWKKWEARPELKALLEQNFLSYDGTGEVPSQIHSYLSTQFKELRNLAKDHAQLRQKGKDRWYVPDPKKNVDVETVRNKRLLEEFWSYLPDGYLSAARSPDRNPTLSIPGLASPRPKVPRSKKLKQVRTEAVRVGFKYCYQQKDYPTILAVADMLPESVLNEDEQLQMLYDNAALRAEATS
ncbi:MAG: hypothetical protein JNK23_00075 [Opitutaceae bacterium]|nr:hypothetical protein [Opitutaceae bacterium]